MSASKYIIVPVAACVALALGFLLVNRADDGSASLPPAETHEVVRNDEETGRTIEEPCGADLRNDATSAGPAPSASVPAQDGMCHSSGAASAEPTLLVLPLEAEEGGDLLPVVAWLLDLGSVAGASAEGQELRILVRAGCELSFQEVRGAVDGAGWRIRTEDLQLAGDVAIEVAGIPAHRAAEWNAVAEVMSGLGVVEDVSLASRRVYKGRIDPQSPVGFEEIRNRIDVALRGLDEARTEGFFVGLNVWWSGARPAAGSMGSGGCGAGGCGEGGCGGGR